MDLKSRKQQILAIAAFVLLGAAAIFAFRSDPSRPPSLDAYQMVCVKTGKRYELPRNRVQMLPAENPDTKEYTLIPCEQRDGDGRWVVVEHYGSQLAKLADVNKYVDPTTLEIKEAP